MGDIDWGAALDQKYKLLAQNAASQDMQAQAEMIKANAYGQNVGNDYDIAKQRYYPGGLDERQYQAQEAGATYRTNLNNQAMEGVRGAEANAHNASARHVSSLTDSQLMSNDAQRYVLPLTKTAMLTDVMAQLSGNTKNINAGIQANNTAFGTNVPNIQSYDPSSGRLTYGKVKKPNIQLAAPSESQPWAGGAFGVDTKLPLNIKPYDGWLLPKLSMPKR